MLYTDTDTGTHIQTHIHKYLKDMKVETRMSERAKVDERMGKRGPWSKGLIYLLRMSR